MRFNSETGLKNMFKHTLKIYANFFGGLILLPYMTRI